MDAKQLTNVWYFCQVFFFKLLKLTTDAAAAVTVCHGTCLQCKYFKCKMYLMFSSQMHFSLEPMNHFPCSIYPKVLINSVSLSTVILPVSYKYSVEASTHKWWMVEMSGATPVIFPQLGLEADWWEYNKHQTPLQGKWISSKSTNGYSISRFLHLQRLDPGVQIQIRWSNSWCRLNSSAALQLQLFASDLPLNSEYTADTLF